MDTESLGLLHEIARNLARLVTFEEERRDAERQMESLSAALLPGTTEHLPDDWWYRDSRGNLVERESHRLLTPQEIESVTYSRRRRAS